MKKSMTKELLEKIYDFHKHGYKPEEIEKLDGVTVGSSSIRNYINGILKTEKGIPLNNDGVSVKLLDQFCAEHNIGTPAYYVTPSHSERHNIIAKGQVDMDEFEGYTDFPPMDISPDNALDDLPDEEIPFYPEVDSYTLKDVVFELNRIADLLERLV